MSQSIALAEDQIPGLIDRLLEPSNLCRGIERQVLADLLRRAGHRLHLAAGEDLIREGDSADSLSFIESGSFEILKRNGEGSASHRIGTVQAGAVVGEVALLDRGARSATVRAIEPAVVLVLRTGEFDAATLGGLEPAVQMRLNLAQEIARRVRDSTDNAVQHLERSLLEAQTRAEMGAFMSRVLIGTCLYMFALVLMERWKSLVADSTVFSTVVLLGFAGGLILNIRGSMFPPSAYGFNCRDWRPALREALLFSLPVLGLIVLAKWILMRTQPGFAGLSLFDFYAYKGLSRGETLAVVLAYSLFVPVQEMIARSGIQSSMMMFLRSRHRVGLSIFMSTLLFSATHLHTTFAFAVIVFPFGLFWGWLYDRHPTLIGVVFSHLLIGLWAVFVVSFPFF